MMPLDAGQIDDTDPRIKRIICIMCKRMLFVERGSCLDTECMCDRCSRITDVIAETIGTQ